VREVNGKIRALISALAPLFSAQLVLFNPTVSEIRGLTFLRHIHVAGAPSVPKFAIALNFSAQLMLFNLPFSELVLCFPPRYGISRIPSQRVQRQQNPL
jgi:hypothetical protein